MKEGLHQYRLITDSSQISIDVFLKDLGDNLRIILYKVNSRIEPKKEKKEKDKIPSLWQD